MLRRRLGASGPAGWGGLALRRNSWRRFYRRNHVLQSRPTLLDISESQLSGLGGDSLVRSKRSRLLPRLARQELLQVGNGFGAAEQPERAIVGRLACQCRLGCIPGRQFALGDGQHFDLGTGLEIGRASCRERVEISVV